MYLKVVNLTESTKLHRDCQTSPLRGGVVGAGAPEDTLTEVEEVGQDPTLFGFNAYLSNAYRVFIKNCPMNKPCILFATRLILTFNQQG